MDLRARPFDRPRTLTALALVATAASGAAAEFPELGLRVSDGFVVERFADDALAPDVYAMTLDPEGRVVVSSKGYIKRLLDSDGDGFADADQLLVKSRHGAMGMLFEGGDTLLAVEGGAVNRYSDADGDGALDPEPETLANFGGGEHGAHALRRDARGHLYLIGGNDAKFTGHEAIDPEQRDLIEGGAILRVGEFGKWSVVAHGFRNPYDFDIDAEGELFCYDSDCEREFFLPWYSPTRLYQVETGRWPHHGWRLQGWRRGWKRPDYYPDSVEPLVNVGRGSPTGVAVYRHSTFPPRYEGGVFYADWTFGKIYFTHPISRHDPGGARAEVFLESTGAHGFAPTDIEVAADGSLFISMGGRGTSGTVFRVRAADPRGGGGAAPPGAVQTWPPESLAGNAPPLGPDLLPDSTEDAASAAHALAAGFAANAEERMLHLRMLMVALGDWNLHGPSAETFTGYELASEWIFEEEHGELLRLCRETLRPLLHALDDDTRREAARLLAMLRDLHPLTATRLLDAIGAGTDPVEDFHYLTCLARLDIELGEGETKRAADAILALDRKIAGRQMRSKQTYTDRLNEVVAALAERAPALFATLLADPRLAAPNYAGVAASFPAAERAEAGERFLAAMAAAPDAGWREDALGLIEGIPLAACRDTLRRLAADPLLAHACAARLGEDPQEADRDLLNATGGLAGLAKLPPQDDDASLLALFRAGDRERALPLIARAAGRESFPDRALAEAWLATKKPALAAALGIGTGATGDGWRALVAEADFADGDPVRGAAQFAARGCATCHAASNALGPDLAGAAARLSPTDLFKAVAEPDADVPEAYRATVFTMRDGTTHVGRIAFTSADGRIVQTAAGTVRLPEDDIASEVAWERSLMPKGLLAGMSAEDLADLYAFLKSL